MATAKKNTKNSKSSKGKGEVLVTELIDSASVADEELAQRFKAHEGYVYYFAYDEDVDDDQIAQQCPGAEMVDRVSVRHYGFGVGEYGKPTIVEKGNHDLVGILWALPREEAESLAAHRVEQGYAPLLLEVSFELKPLNRRKRIWEQFAVEALAFETSGLKLMKDMGDASKFELVASLRRGVAMKEDASLTEIIELCGGRPVPTSKYDDYNDYVCNRCYQPLGECACPGGASDLLIKVDRGIQHAIHVLNLKGYCTRFSCEGHPRGTYIMFHGGYCLPKEEIPENFTLKGLALYADYPKKAAREECEDLKAQRLEALNTWVDTLPVNEQAPYWV